MTEFKTDEMIVQHIIVLEYLISDLLFAML